MDTMAVLDDVASEQWGLVTAAQAKGQGVPLQGLARWANRGRLERLSHGVYRMSGSPQHPLEGIRAAWLALNPGTMAGQRARHGVVGVVSHGSAAQVHQVGDLDTDLVEFTTFQRRQTRRPDVRFHVLALGRDEWELVDGLPVTTLVRTVADLARSSLDGGHLAGVVRDAVVDHHVDIADLADALDPYAERYGVGRERGDELVTQFLQEAGIPDSTTRAVVAAAGPGWTLDPQFIADLNAQITKNLSPALSEYSRVLNETALHDAPTRKLFAEALEPIRQQLQNSGSVLDTPAGARIIAQAISRSIPAVDPFQKASRQARSITSAAAPRVEPETDQSTGTSSSTKKGLMDSPTSNTKKTKTTKRVDG